MGREKNINMKTQKREMSFDIAKGIGMLAVILGHMTLPQKMTDFIFSFHMPLFFLISGYFFRASDNREILYKKTKSLLLPYIVTCGMVILFSTLFKLISGASVYEIVANIKMWILAAAYGSGTYTSFFKWNFHIIGAIWFLLALFWAEMIFNLIVKTKWCYIWGTLIALIGYVTTSIIWLPLSIQAGMNAIVFLEIGYYVRKKNLLEKFQNNLLVIMTSIGLWSYSIIYGGKLYMVGNHYGNGIMDVLGAVSATFLILKFAKFIEQNFVLAGEKLAEYGRESLIVLCFHLIELNTFPWRKLIFKLAHGKNIVLFICKIIWGIVGVRIVSHNTWLRYYFGKK